MCFACFVDFKGKNENESFASCSYGTVTKFTRSVCVFETGS